MTELPDREQRLLAMLLAVDPADSPYSAEFSGEAGEVDWAYFEALVKRHRVAALVHAGLAKSEQIVAPADVRERFASATSKNAHDFMRAVQVAGKLTAAMREIGIGCAVLKGFGIAAHYYDKPSDREMIDIDLLVEPNRYEEAEAIVRSHGFEQFYPRFALKERTRRSFYRLHNAFTFIRREDGLQIDLHWRFVQNPVLLAGLDASWPEKVVEDGAAGLSVPMLSPSVHMLYIAVHGIKHGWVRLKWLADVDRVVRGLTADEVIELSELAEANALGGVLAASIDLSRRLLGTPLPDVMKTLVEAHNTEQLITLELPMIFGETPAREHSIKDWRYFVRRIRHSMLLHKGRGYRRETMLRELARPEDLEALPLPPGAVWLLPILSPILEIGRMFKR